MKSIFSLAAVFALLLAHSSTSFASSEEYSVEAYCLLLNSNVSENYLKAYEKKLGMKPSARTCRSFKEVAESMKKPKWNFRNNRPYPGSVIKLTNKQVEMLKAAQEKTGH